MMFNNIAEVKNIAVEIKGGMSILDRKTGNLIQHVILDHPENWKKTFSSYFGAYSFVDENGTYFAIPDMPGIKEQFLMNGYCEKNYSSPLNKGTKEPSGAWEYACSLA